MKTFLGGVHPPEAKEATADLAIVSVPAPAVVAVPLAQSLGKPAAPVVEKGAPVKVGSLIGRAAGFVSAAVHSPVSGRVKAVEKRTDFLGRWVEHVVLENDGKDEWAPGTNDPAGRAPSDPAALRARVLEAGIVGMGGATFPSHVKLSPPQGKPIDTVVLNGAECEPYLTCDYRLMMEETEAVLEGLEFVRAMTLAARSIVAIEANKPEAIRRFSALAAGKPNLSVETMEAKYPQGGERQLISALLGRTVPAGGLPLEVGVVVHNVGTAFAIREAVCRNKPLVERVLTVSGDAIERPGNFRVRVGTPIRILFERCGLKPFARRLILGGPMMGLSQRSLELPVTKGTSGVLALKGDDPAAWGDCVRCGRCVRACPQRINPSMLSIAAECRREDLFAGMEYLECVECGACAYVCPARRPIVQFVKYAKEALRLQKANAPKPAPAPAAAPAGAGERKP